MKYKPKNLWGKIFLNKNMIKDIVELGKVTTKVIVIEIGPETGNLTKEILKKNPKNF